MEILRNIQISSISNEKALTPDRKKVIISSKSNKRRMIDMIKLKDVERFTKDLQRGFRPATKVKVNRSEVRLLLMLNDMPERPFRDYGKQLQVEKSSFSYIVDLLVLKELVNKVEDENDKRRKTLKITEKGYALIAELQQQHEAYLKERMSIFTEDEMDQLENAFNVISSAGEKIRVAYPRKRRKPDDKPHPRD